MSTTNSYSYRDLQDELHNGDCLSQKEFHRRYEETAEGFRAELINSTVFVAEPVSQPHCDNHALLIAVLYAYSAQTKGLATGCDGTVILSKKDEVQPDVVMRILPEYKGKTHSIRRGEKSYIEGPPELLAEVSYSSVAIDLHLKRQCYERAGVGEYLVLCLKPNEIFWFDLPRNERLMPGSDGIIRSRIFPGLWIQREALLKRDYVGLMNELNLGLSSSEHEDFVERLANRRYDV